MAALPPNQAALPPNHDALEAVTLCGVSNAPRAGIVGTDAERIAENVFNNDFESCMDYDEEQLKADLKSFSEL